jgi:hypothetical protein
MTRPMSTSSVTVHGDAVGAVDGCISDDIAYFTIRYSVDATAEDAS